MCKETYCRHEGLGLSHVFGECSVAQSIDAEGRRPSVHKKWDANNAQTLTAQSSGTIGQHLSWARLVGNIFSWPWSESQGFQLVGLRAL